VNRSNYLEDEITIQLDPKKAEKYQISITDVLSEIKNNNVRIPAGTLKDDNESSVTLLAELDTIEDLENLTIQGSFNSNFIRLRDVATIRSSFQETTQIMKANGYESVQLNIVKSSDSGIIDSVDEVQEQLEKFRQNNLKDTSVKLITLDDESITVRNRISLIVQNGMIGFLLILAILFIFLNFKAGFWVAIGIPFTVCFTMIAGSLMGLTINNVTLAAVIVVLGMVVDDAIVVAENITRQKMEGADDETASIDGTTFVFQPIVASIITTCLAFVPLLMFQGKMSRIIQSMPVVISLMLAASLFESTLILPGHLNLHLPIWIKSFRPKKKQTDKKKRHWFYNIEDRYGKLLQRILKHKAKLLALFVLLLVGSLFIFKTQFKFAMFPNEETTELRLSGIVPAATDRLATAEKVRELEDVINSYVGKEVVGYRTYIARGMRGRMAEENNFFMVIELVPVEKRNISSKKLLKKWTKEFDKITGLDRFRINKSRFGQASGSPMEIVVLENDDKVRARIANEIVEYLNSFSVLKNAEIDEPMKNWEYTVKLKRDYIRRLGVSPGAIGSTLRSIVEGSRLYYLMIDDQEVDVKLTSFDKYRYDIDSLLALPVETSQGYLVPLNRLVDYSYESVPSSIERENQKRRTKVFADLKEDVKRTPLDVATQIEAELFPTLMAESPSSYIYFAGEVEESRESANEFAFGLGMVLLLIYIILSLLFNSLSVPLVIMLSIPFGVIGVIIAYYFHGMHLYGFFTLIGVLGLSGIVVNDSIVMIAKLLDEQRKKKELLVDAEIADIAKTRLRAVVLTTITTVAGLFPTAYGIAGYDSMLGEMMLAMGWGLIFATVITLCLVPVMFSVLNLIKRKFL